MDILFLVTLFLGVPVIVFAAITWALGDLRAFYDVASVWCTVGGSITGVLLSTHWRNYPKFFRLFYHAARPPRLDARSAIPTLISFAEKARREGLLSLEENVPELDDEFLKKGIQLVVDGTDPDLVKSILRTELQAFADRHQDNIKLLRDWAQLAPAWGMIGTLIGLIIMLRNLNNPMAIGQGMATAIITTFYGAVFGYGILIPVANRLEEYTRKEYGVREVMIEGVLSIQSGDNPRIVTEKLLAFINPGERDLVPLDDRRLLLGAGSRAGQKE